VPQCRRKECCFLAKLSSQNPVRLRSQCGRSAVQCRSPFFLIPEQASSAAGCRQSAPSKKSRRLLSALAALGRVAHERFRFVRDQKELEHLLFRSSSSAVPAANALKL
jgi:hypothetical protein